MRRTIATLGALLATLIAAGPAAAGVATPVTVSLPTLITHPQSNVQIGVYQWSVSNLPVGAPAEFTVGQHLGHCVNFLNAVGASTDATLRSGNDVDLRTHDPNGILTAGAADPRVSQVKWLLLSSLARSVPDHGDLAAAHQLAIWRITNPTTGPAASETTFYDDPANAAAPSLSTRLLAQAQAEGASANNAAALLGGGASPTCAGTTRAITVTGAPFTTASISISGPGSVDGLIGFPVDLGSSGKAILNVLGTGLGSVTVSASVKEATMVQVAMANLAYGAQKQDMATIAYKTVSVSTSITFVDCTPPTSTGPAVVPPTKVPKTKPAAHLTIVKGADRAVVLSGGIVHYTITVRNTGPDAATNLRTCDRLPDGMTYVSIGGGRLDRGRACFTKASLSAGASMVYQLVARVDAGVTGTFVNHATTSADNAPSRSAMATVRAKAPLRRTPHHNVHGVVG